MTVICKVEFFNVDHKFICFTRCVCCSLGNVHPTFFLFISWSTYSWLDKKMDLNVIKFSLCKTQREPLTFWLRRDSYTERLFFFFSASHEFHKLENRSLPPLLSYFVTDSLYNSSFQIFVAHSLYAGPYSRCWGHSPDYSCLGVFHSSRGEAGKRKAEVNSKMPDWVEINAKENKWGQGNTECRG